MNKNKEKANTDNNKEKENPKNQSGKDSKKGGAVLGEINDSPKKATR